MTGSGESGSGRDAGKPARPRDRRATPRAAIEIPALLRLGARDVDCSIRDLSTLGVALTLKESVPPGMVVRLVFRLPNSRQPIDVAGVLVRQEGGRGETVVGLQFLEPGVDSVRVIRTFVARNRSDGPFSRRSTGARTEPTEDGESAAELQGLYRKAVGDVAEKGAKRRGLLARWLRRDRS